MTGDQLRALQAPLKAKFKDDPAAAKYAISISGTLEGDDIRCRVQSPRGPIDAGLHTATASAWVHPTGNSGLSATRAGLSVAPALHPPGSWLYPARNPGLYAARPAWVSAAARPRIRSARRHHRRWLSRGSAAGQHSARWLCRRPAARQCHRRRLQREPPAGQHRGNWLARSNHQQSAGRGVAHT